MTPAELEQLGLGLQAGTVRHAPARREWQSAALELIAELRDALGPMATGLEHIGSTAVVGLLAKPIVDIAIELAADVDIDRVVDVICSLGYEYRGDAANNGGVVFVLDVRPSVRVAHVHAITHGDVQWGRYLEFVALLSSDAKARAAYETVKRELAAANPDGREEYTSGKTDIVSQLLTDR
jgi:GrpB-like predicted nucleotidyltransferase (UPF0157 family)